MYTLHDFYAITTALGCSYKRHAWTGGDVAPENARRTDPEYRALVSAFFREQVAESGGLDFWKPAGTSALERARILWNTARLDAWRTLDTARKTPLTFSRLPIGARFRWRTLRGGGDLLQKMSASTYRNITTRGPERPLTDSIFGPLDAVRLCQS